ncbi:ABC transporter permease [Dermacoccus nishinomiyaensis]|uniref:ABC transporter permease n=1 Tax=Dermacoccus nishinomiyaensis TaxID=1274 RepID=UPI00119DE6CD|nr:FtsX-like permease family protein [Dermacoccus nishinomiyaensis]
MSFLASNLVLGSLRERGTITLAAGLAGAYSAFMLVGSKTLGAIAATSYGSNASVGRMYDMVAGVFITIALYVSAIVIAGCVATVISGRLQQIATLRLLGADARSLRGRVVREVGATAAIGSALGAIVGTAVADLGRAYLMRRGTFPQADYPLASELIIPALVAVVVVAALAGRVGSQRVLTVNPAAAMSGTTPTQERRATRLRGLFAALFAVAGAATLAMACRLGEQGSSAGLLMASFGSMLFVLGVITGAPFVLPRVVEAFGRLLGTSPDARIARRNAVADPMRTTRATLGLVIGVGLVTTFAAGSAALSASIETWDLSAADRARFLDVMHMVSIVMIALVVIASIIAGVGFVSTMSLVVIQRRREIGMLRAMGFTARQIRGMVTRESLALGLTAVLVGIALGVLLGSVGAQSLIGAGNDGFVWGLPFEVLAVIVIAALALVLVAALPPARRATTVTPVEALRVV